MNISPRLRLVILGAALILVCGTLAAIIASQLDTSLSATFGEGINPTAAMKTWAFSEFATVMERPTSGRRYRPRRDSHRSRR